jgi:AbrB family looped-hinge helix DNA binding protein
MAVYIDLTFPTTVTVKGRVTIPDQIRRTFKIEVGDTVFLRIEKVKHKEI